MLNLSKYNIYIFDCDGVILDSNSMKIDAMKGAVERSFSDVKLVDQCATYFRKNFGKSRFHHIDVFLSDILPVENHQKERLRDTILNDFSAQCKRLYLEASLTPGFIEFIKDLEGCKYVASGSEQQELREVFKQRNIAKYFEGIYGSPTRKASLIKTILEKESNNNAVMFGDSEADLISALENNIDFVFYSPFSNVKEEMLATCSEQNLPVINSFLDVRLI